MSSPGKAQKPQRYELWLRVECPDKECKTKEGRNWTFIPAREMPRRVPCVVCARPMDTEKLAREGVEWRRRGVNANADA